MWWGCSKMCFQIIFLKNKKNRFCPEKLPVMKEQKKYCKKMSVPK